MEHIIESEKYQWEIKEEYLSSEENISFILNYLGSDEGRLYLNSMVSGGSHYLALSRPNDDYLIKDDSIENRNFLIGFAFQIFDNMQDLKEVTTSLDEFLDGVEIESATTINWYTRLKDLVIRIGVKNPGYGKLRIGSVWILDIEAYELKINSEAMAYLDRVKTEPKTIVFEDIAISELMKKVNEEKYFVADIYKVATIQDGNHTVDAIIVEMPLTKEEMILNRKYFLTYHSKQDLYVVDYSLKLN